jgi:hypothetical protein
MCVIKNVNEFHRIYHIQHERKAGPKLVLRKLSNDERAPQGFNFITTNIVSMIKLSIKLLSENLMTDRIYPCQG